jgi:hypothetical protein
MRRRRLGPSKDKTIDVSRLDDEETTLIIKSFQQILMNRKDKDYKPTAMQEGMQRY